MDAPAADFCPYVGLQPYTEADRAYFFGRERDQEIILSNLYAAPLTVLYGASGVGKSSVLLAGVVPQLRQSPRAITVVFREWQSADFALALKQEVLEATRARVGADGARQDALSELRPRCPALPLDELVQRCVEITRRPLFFIFDQFEEYFLYHRACMDEDCFEAELARTVNREDIHANFLLTLREDGLSKLDRFQGRIPNLMGNLLRLEHLDHQAARAAVLLPLREYNRRVPRDRRMFAGEGLMETVLDQVEAGKVTLNESHPTRPHGEAALARIETPFLQIVLTRLWTEERRSGSRRLRLETFRKLGEARRIVSTHLDEVMRRFSSYQQNVAALLFRVLVTPTGTKIAHTLEDLASPEYGGPDKEAVTLVLNRLLAADIRVLRTVTAPGQPARYEIFHDVLAAAVLDWRRRHDAIRVQEALRRNERRRRMFWLIPALSLGLAFTTYSAMMWYWNAAEAEQQAEAARRAEDVAKRRTDEAVEAKKDSLLALLHAQMELQRTAEASEQTSRALKAIVDAAKADPKLLKTLNTEELPPSISIQIPEEAQRDGASELEQKLKASGYAVIGVDKVPLPPGQPLVAPPRPRRSELRYFRESETKEAKEIANRLREMGFDDLEVNHVPGPANSPKVKLKQYELWIAPDAPLHRLRDPAVELRSSSFGTGGLGNSTLLHPRERALEAPRDAGVPFVPETGQ